MTSVAPDNRSLIEIPFLLNQKKLPALDGLRAVSIAFVIFCHFIFFTAFNEATNFGMVGVDIFFVISGFLITTLLLKEQILNGKISLKDFYIRRALRILPVVLLFLAALLLINQIFGLGINKLSFIASLLFIRNLPIPHGDDWHTAHFWSLGVEEQFYLLFPFLVARMKIQHYKKLVLTLICVIPVVNYVFYNKVGLFETNRIIHSITLIFANLMGKGTALILVGFYLSVLMFTKSKLVRFADDSRPGIFSLVIFVFALIIRFPSSPFFVQYFSDIVFAFLIGIVIMLNLKGESIMARILNLKWMVRLGILSYSLYIWQQIFTHEQPWANSFRYADAVAFNLAALLIVGFASYYFYERWFLKLKGRFEVSSRSVEVKKTSSPDGLPKIVSTVYGVRSIEKKENPD